MREPFHKAKLYLNALMTLEIIIGFAVITSTYFYQSFLSKYIADMQSKLFGGQFFNAYIFGLQLILAHTAGLNIWQKLWRCKYSTVIEILLFAWTFLNFLIVMSGFGVVWSIYKCDGAFHNTAEMSMREGMDRYFESPEWKLLWDGLQYHKQCCGIRGYKDWMRASWMANLKRQAIVDEEESITEAPEPNEDLFDYMERRSREARANSTVFAPYACCKQTSVICYESYLPQVDFSRDMPALSESEINTKGCLPYFSQAMWDLLKLLTILVCVSFTVNLMICFLTKKILWRQVLTCKDSTNMTFVDEEGRSVVYLKYPPNVSCVTVNEGEYPDKKKPSGPPPRRPCQTCHNGLPRNFGRNCPTCQTAVAPPNVCPPFPNPVPNFNQLQNAGANRNFGGGGGGTNLTCALPTCEHCGKFKINKTHKGGGIYVTDHRECRCNRCTNPRILH